ncbi:MAG: hypothetical protein COV72_04285 [Candidatus Omnitrophica bacterium CG11_big_fil_rev_8_21_14_0_20_42_13]|uniref:HTH merR-type domain-containing protein n=1 Tax=Candidatus Ghiorseimicrobium undicola TaxID=1974746 RepID=A0A2H0LXX0_9BACT|nr:MAG: hypothetical protein COV72_04285 [Candidatus Omnitrophica bacterium CG11_big_fil_rev_8_21_14_0_20_42_13]
MTGNGRLTITDVAKHIGVTTKTIIRWEASGKIIKSKRDWRGWRVYTQDDLRTIQDFHNTLYEY